MAGSKLALLGTPSPSQSLGRAVLSRATPIEVGPSVTFQNQVSHEVQGRDRYESFAAYIPTRYGLRMTMAFAQQCTAELAIKAALVDRDLNLGPIPKTIFVLKSLPNGAKPTQDFQITTSFEGLGETDLPPAEYRLD